MTRLTPVHWRILRKVFEKAGFRFRKGKGDHWVGEKAGCTRPVVIPEYSEIDRDIILSNLRSAGMSREEYLRRLKE